MLCSKLLAFVALVSPVIAQTFTLSGCHRHGNVEYCYLPDGKETPFTTYASSQTASPATATASATSETTAASTTEPEALPATVSGCHPHGTILFCMVNGEEYEVKEGVEDVASAPKSFSGCHGHGEELHCTGDGQSVSMFPMEASAESEEGHDHAEGEAHAGGEANPADGALPEGAVDCHFHAGVEHCVDANGNTVDRGCTAPQREYNVPLRIGLLFVILATSALGVYGPMVVSRLTKVRFDGIVFIALRQFGTGIIISTALVHLLTHAQLFFSSDCLTGMHYEATAAALVMAGLFVTFLLEFLVHHVLGRKVEHHADTKDVAQVESATSDGPEDIVVTPSSVSVMEAGIVFHSVLIGITLVVAGDTSFITLFVVILFHQMFEGIALGTRIAMMAPAGTIKKILMAGLFAIVTPIGMAIGIGVLSSFNGNDPSTIVAIATLNAFSAGILLWVGLVEMWADEWWRGPLAGAGWLKVTVGMISLMLGMALMSLLGRWA